MARRMIGTVVSDIQDKTVVVKTVRRVTHPIYRKQYTVSTKTKHMTKKTKLDLVIKFQFLKLDQLAKLKPGS